MAALRCGETLLHSFTYADEWPVDGLFAGKRAAVEWTV
jgi:hypothetical protein